MQLKAKTKNEKRKARNESIRCRLSDFVFLFSFLVSCSCPVFAADTAAQHFQTGLAYERLGRSLEAYTALQLAFALDQDDAQKAVALGVVACRLGHYEAAQRAFERSIAVDANSVASYYHLALLYEKLALKDRAIDSWRRFSSLSQDDTLKALAKKHLQHLEGHS